MVRSTAVGLLRSLQTLAPPLAGLQRAEAVGDHLHVAHPIHRRPEPPESCLDEILESYRAPVFLTRAFKSNARYLDWCWMIREFDVCVLVVLEKVVCFGLFRCVRVGKSTSAEALPSYLSPWAVRKRSQAVCRRRPFVRRAITVSRRENCTGDRVGLWLLYAELQGDLPRVARRPRLSNAGASYRRELPSLSLYFSPSNEFVSRGSERLVAQSRLRLFLSQLCVPDWPMFNRNPVNWLKEIPADEPTSQQKQPSDEAAASKPKAAKAKKSKKSSS